MLNYRLAAQFNAWSQGWPTRVPFKQLWKILRKNSRVAWEHPHLFDDDRQRKHLCRLADIVRGKTVAVVGNAQYMLETTAGSEIEANDVIIRFNTGFVVAPSSQGSRTDVLCIAMSLAPDEVARRCPGALVVFVSPVRAYLHKEFRPDVENCPCTPLGDWRQLVRALGDQRPSAGLIIVDYLLHRSEAAKVSLYGFDWKRTKSFYHVSKIKDWHSGEAERRLLLKWELDHSSRLNFGNCPMGPPG